MPTKAKLDKSSAQSKDQRDLGDRDRVIMAPLTNQRYLQDSCKRDILKIPRGRTSIKRFAVLLKVLTEELAARMSTHRINASAKLIKAMAA
jgi:hypothetical protein